MEEMWSRRHSVQQWYTTFYTCLACGAACLPDGMQIHREMHEKEEES